MTVKTDVVAEYTSGSGVTIDGVLLKDGFVDGVDVSALSTSVNDAAQAIPHAAGTTLMLPDTMEYVARGAYNIRSNGADQTDEIKAAIAAMAPVRGAVVFSPGSYQVTDTISVPAGVSLISESLYASPQKQAGIEQPPSVTIVFAPTSEKDLFDITTVGAFSYVTKVSIRGLSLIGNTTGGVTFSRYAINSCAADSTFEGLGIEQFQVGIYSTYTMTNVYRDIYIGACSEACIKTSTQDNMADIYEHVMMRGSPWGAILQTALDFKFIGCLWESLTVGGVQIYQECKSVEFIACYAENTPSGSGGTNYGMFYVNHAGSTVRQGTITILGGEYGGKNGAPFYGSFLDVDETSYIKNVAVIGVNYSRYTNGIKVSATTTVPYSVFVSGNSIASITNEYVNQKQSTVYGYPLIYGVLGSTTSGTNFPTVASQHLMGFDLALQEHATSSVLVYGMGGSLVDDEEAYISAMGTVGNAGLIAITISGAVGAGWAHEAALISIAGKAGTVEVVLVSNTTNVSVTNADGKLCVYPAGDGSLVAIKNRLGATLNYRVLRVG